MRFPLSPVMFVTLLFAAGIATGHADYTAGWHAYTIAALSAAVIAMAACWKRLSTARWRIGMAGVAMAAFGGGWLADKVTWMSIEYQQAKLLTLEGDTHMGVVVGTPTRFETTIQMPVELGNGCRVRLAVPCELTDGTTIYEGNTLAFRSKLKPYAKDGKGRYDLYNLHQGMVGSGFVTDIRILDTEAAHWWTRWRVSMLKRLRNAGLAEDAEAMTAALLFADKSGLTRDVKDSYRDAGASHVLALSGMHLGVLMAVLLALFGRQAKNSRRNAICISCIVWTYVLVAGAPLSLVRAAWLQTLALTAIALKRRVQLFDALCSALLLMLVWSPHALFDVGFQLSFACVFGLALADVYLPEWMAGTGNAVTGTFRAGIICSVSTIPLTMFWFHRITLYSCLSGIVLIPMTMLTIVVGAGTLAFPNPVLCLALEWLVAAETTVAEFFASLPLASIEV